MPSLPSALSGTVLGCLLRGVNRRFGYGSKRNVIVADAHFHNGFALAAFYPNAALRLAFEQLMPANGAVDVFHLQISFLYFRTNVRQYNNTDFAKVKIIFCRFDKNSNYFMQRVHKLRISDGEIAANVIKTANKTSFTCHTKTP